MRKEFYKSKLATYFLHEELNVIEQLWTNRSKKMSGDTYKDEMWNYLKFVKEYKTKLALINLQGFYFTIPLELQVWVDNNINLEASKFVTKVAFIMPVDLIQGMSVQQTMNKPKAKFHISEGVSFFEREEDAFNWLTNEQVQM